MASMSHHPGWLWRLLPKNQQPERPGAVSQEEEYLPEEQWPLASWPQGLRQMASSRLEQAASPALGRAYS
jgi:hypothetical protein